MTSQERDKFICDKLGACWHDYKWLDTEDVGGGYWICSCCTHKTHFAESFKHNPSFTSEAGRVQLLKLLNGEDMMWKFFTELPDKQIGLFQYLVMYMAGDECEFRDAVFKWLGGEE